MRRTSGQSLVEMALLLPLMLILLFGIVDMGWYVYGYATIYQSVRNGAEAAASLPPFETTLKDAGKRGNDPCYQAIVNQVEADATMFPDIGSHVVVSYPASSSGNGKGKNSSSSVRSLGNPIQVQVDYPIEPLTPLFQLVPLIPGGKFAIKAQTIRSIENLGTTLISEKYPNGIACSQ